jgi:putative nucleotidyltransferase-like protein
MRTEAALIVQCARRRLDDPGAARLRALAGLPLDWPWVLEAARYHGALPLLLRHLDPACADVVPPAVLEALRECRRTDARRALRLAAELVWLLDALSTRGISAVALKGPALGAALYGDVTLRPCRDLDLLVPETRILDAEAVLTSLGYRGEPAIQGPWGPADNKEWERVLSREGEIVELHVRLMPRAFAFSLDGAALWQRLDHVRIGGRDVPTLGHEDLLLYLSAHGARHRWGRLEWIADIAELVRSRPGIDWYATLDRATRLGGQRMLLLGLMLAAELLDAPVPDDLRARGQVDRAVRGLTRGIGDRLFEQVSVQPVDGWEWLRWYTDVRERAADKLRCAWRIVFAPGPADWEWIRLPRALSGLYFLARLVRLAWKYVARGTQDTIKRRDPAAAPQVHAA